MVKSHFLGNEGSDYGHYGSVIKFKKVLSYLTAMRLALGAIRDMLKFIEPYCKKDVMV